MSEEPRKQERIQIKKSSKGSKPKPVEQDLRSPSGRKLPF